MIDLKPYGAFVENTVRPLLSELKALFDEMRELHIPLDKANIEWLINFLAERYKTHLVIDLCKTVITTAIVCWTVIRLMK